MWRWLLVLAGCSSGFQTIIHEPASAPRLSALVVPAVRLTGSDASAWRAFELAQRQVSVILRHAGDRLAVIGPAEVSLTRWEDQSWLGSNALPAIKRAQLAPDEALLLRARIEQREATSTAAREDAKGNPQRELHGAEVRWLVTVELVHPATSALLVQLNGEVIEDPFAVSTGEEEFDPHWPMTRLLEKLTKEALDIAHRWEAPAGASRELNLTVALAPAFTAAQPDAAAAQTDALQAEVWMQNRARFLTPWLDDAAAARLARTPVSLLVLAAPGGAPVQPGDLILSINGQPPLPEVLARAHLKGPAHVHVGRDGQERDEVLP